MGIQQALLHRGAGFPFFALFTRAVAVNFTCASPNGVIYQILYDYSTGYHIFKFGADGTLLGSVRILTPNFNLQGIVANASEEVYIVASSGSIWIIKLSNILTISWQKSVSRSGFSIEAYGSPKLLSTGVLVVSFLTSQTPASAAGVLFCNSAGTSITAYVRGNDTSGNYANLGGACVDNADNVYVTGSMQISGTAYSFITKWNSAGTFQASYTCGAGGATTDIAYHTDGFLYAAMYNFLNKTVGVLKLNTSLAKQAEGHWKEGAAGYLASTTRIHVDSSSNIFLSTNTPSYDARILKTTTSLGVPVARGLDTTPVGGYALGSQVQSISNTAFAWGFLADPASGTRATGVMALPKDMSGTKAYDIIDYTVCTQPTAFSFTAGAITPTLQAATVTLTATNLTFTTGATTYTYTKYI